MSAITSDKAHAILRDIFHCRHDVLALAQVHELDPVELARWAARPQVREALAGLCTLADFQTQILLSRYRSLAAGRLVKLAGGESDAGGDLARRACMDLLRLDLKRAQADAAGEAEQEDEPSLRELLRRAGTGEDTQDQEQEQGCGG